MDPNLPDIDESDLDDVNWEDDGGFELEIIQTDNDSTQDRAEEPPPPEVPLEEMKTVQEVLNSWEKQYATEGYNPAPHLNKLSEILESEYEKYLKSDPDPFDDRHPLKIAPSYSFGHSLKQVFKRELLINRIVGDYLRENWGETDMEVNTAACRLFINLLSGLENNIDYQETEGLISRLFTWAERAPEPLQSYSLGILGAAMEIPEVAGKYKDKNTVLVPLMLKRLKEIHRTFDEPAGMHRPFAHLNRSTDNSYPFAYPAASLSAMKNGGSKNGYDGRMRPGKRTFEAMDNDSSSSWAEMESNIIGLMQIYPVDQTSRQIFTLRYLTPLGEYQEMLGFTLAADSISIIRFNIERGNSRLQFETLKYLAALLCHKKFVQEFLTEQNLRMLLSIPRPSISATGLSLVLYYLVYEPDSIIKLNQFNSSILKALVHYVNWLLDCGHFSGRNHALMFYTQTYSHKFILDLFDNTDGLRRVLNIASTAIVDYEKVDENEMVIKKQAVKTACINIKKYFESEELQKPRKMSVAIERFLRLNGVKLLLNISELDNMGPTLVHVFDTLTLICHHGRAQEHIEDRLSVVLQGIEGELAMDPEVQKSCLRLLAKLLSPDSQHLHVLQESARSNNGLLILTRLLFIKVPVTDADSIRTLASDCLIGLTHSNIQMKQIVQNLPIVKNGTLKLLANEPIMEQSTDHARFRKNIDRLTAGDATVHSPIINYEKTELLELIRDFLETSGLHDTAEKLQTEAMLSETTVAKSGAQISLDKIVKEYLQGQHNRCQNPMSIVPKFSLHQTHKCPSVVPKVGTRNIVCRLTDFRTKDWPRKREDHRLVYSKFKPVRTFRLENQDELFSSCTFSSPTNHWFLAGTTVGEVKLYNLSNGEEQATYNVHDGEVYNLQLNNNNSILLTSATWRKPLSCLWRMDRPEIENLAEYPDDEYIELSKVSQHLVIGTNTYSCQVYDIETGERVAKFQSEQSNLYDKNRATFSMDDKLVLNDGILYDYVGNTSIHKFDKLNDHINGVFAENGLEIISNSDVWDIRTFKLLKSVKLLDQRRVTFSDKVLYGLKHPVEGSDLDTCFVTLDAQDYSSISTIELKKPLMHMSTSWNYLQVGIVERLEDDSVVKVYDVGRTKDEEDMDEDESEEEEDDEDDDEIGDQEIVEFIDHLVERENGLDDDDGNSMSSNSSSDDLDDDDGDSGDSNSFM